MKGVGNSDTSTDNLSNTSTNTEDTTNEEKYVTNLANDVKLNTSKDLNSAKNYKNIEITNIQFTSDGGNSLLLADLKNTGTTKHEREIVSLTVLGDNNTEITTFNTSLPDIEPGMTEKLEIHVSADIVNAKDFKISEKK